MDRNINTTVESVQKRVVNRLAPRYGLGEAKAMTRMILENVTGWSQTTLLVNASRELESFTIERISAVVDRLLRGEPIQYIFGKAYFYGLTLKVTPDTLIPRPETAELVDMIVDRNRDESDLEVLDLCTGSGCIAIALARNLRFPVVTGVDFSLPALDVARQNAAALGVNVNFVQADILNTEAVTHQLKGLYDIIVCNPPYVTDSEKAGMDDNVLNHEPHSALFVPDNDPLKFYNATLTLSLQLLRSGGWLYFEINPLFATELKQHITDAGFSDVQIIRDSYGKERFALAKR